MGNQNNLPEARRYQDSPFVCCGQQPRKQHLQQQTSNIMNLQKSTLSKFHRATDSKQLSDQPHHLQQTGSTYYNKNDIAILRRQHNPQNKQIYQSDMKRSGFASFNKPTYGAYNSQNAFGTFNTYGLHTSSVLKQRQQPERDSNIYKQTPAIDFVKEKDLKSQIKRQRQISRETPNKFIGEGRYGGKASEFDNNKKIIKFLQDNHIKQPMFKFYETKDNTFIMNNSTIRFANRKKQPSKVYQQQISSSNLRANPHLSKLQQPIQLTLQIDARIILATCLLIIGIVIVVIGGTVIYSEVNFFICLMVGIILYVFYLIICFIYNDVFMYLFNVRSFDDFEKDYQKLKEAEGEMAYHVHLETSNKVIKQCYLLSSHNKFTKIEYSDNQNKDLQLNDLKDKYTSFLMVKYKTKTAFIDAESQYNTIKYFNQFISQHKSNLSQGGKKKPQKQSNAERNDKEFKKYLKKTDFNYQLQPIDNLTLKPESVFNVCYMDDDDSAGWFILLFIISTILGLCLFFLCFFQAYTKRYRINILNRFKVK